MLQSILTSPLRVYLVLASLAGVGIYAGLSLPVSLFPQTTRPEISVGINFGSMSPQEFRRLYGKTLESELRRIKTPAFHAESIESTYSAQSFRASVAFNWGAPSELAFREVETVFNAATNALPEDIRRSRWVNNRNGNNGFFAMSFYSKKRTLSELHDLLSPVITPRLSRIEDAENSSLWNPDRPSIEVMIKPDMLSAVGITSEHIMTTLQRALRSQNAGGITNGTKTDVVRLLPEVTSFEDLSRIMIPLPPLNSASDHGASNPMTAIALSEVATVRKSQGSEFSQSFKTSGVSSLILFASAKQGANVKNMADQISNTINELKDSFPDDIEYRVLVDPAEFISSAISNVFHEVLMAAGLASLLLYLLIGRLRHVITAAIEIPLSIALAFILMWMLDININLLSLAGLALAAGMNVDASVVVMENIFRHLDSKKSTKMSYNEKIQTVMQALTEVKMPVIASTISSLVVFVPFLFTTGISQAILGDLAKAVIFSHAFSAIIALVLVPAVRLHFLAHDTNANENRAPLDLLLRILESCYHNILQKVLKRPQLAATLATLCLVAASIFALQLAERLPKEIMGKPETNWLFLAVNAQKFTSKRQMEGHIEELQRQKIATFGDKVLYTFDQINGASSASILFKISDKDQLDTIKNQLEELLPETVGMRYHVGPWSPGELHIPDPPQFRFVITGGDPHQRMIAARDLKQLLEGERVFKRVSTDPEVEHTQSWALIPHSLQWTLLQQSYGLTPSTIAEQLRVVQDSQFVGELLEGGQSTSISLRHPEKFFKSRSDLEAYPIRVGGELIPLKALMDVQSEPLGDTIYAEDGEDMHVVYGRLKDDQVANREVILHGLNQKIEIWRHDRLPQLSLPGLAVSSEDPDKDLTKSLDQLKKAFVVSLLLILLTMIFQFGRFAEALIVTLAVPLVLIGAVASLTLFASSLSINAALGMILLNGIAVANSIMLVELGARNIRAGMPIQEALVLAATSRLRPILITSLTTVFGMLPIAFGYGEGGRVLQPLGIAVSGGLWFSMSFTLILVPIFHCLYLCHRERKTQTSNVRNADTFLSTVGVLLAFTALCSLAPRAQANPQVTHSTFDYLAILDQILSKDQNLTSLKLYNEATLEGQRTLDGLFHPELKGELRGDLRGDLRGELSNSHNRVFGRNEFSDKTLGAGISAGVNLYSFGRGKADRSIFNLLEEKSAFKIQVYQMEAEARAMNRLSLWLAAHKQRAVIAKMTQIRTSLLDVGKKQFSRGLLSKQDLNKLTFDLASQKIRHDQSEIEVHKTYEDLKDFVLESLPDNPEQIPWMLKSNLIQLSQAFERFMPPRSQLVINKNPTVAAAGVALREYQVRAERVDSGSRPNLDLQGSLSKNLGSTSSNQDTSSTVAIVLSVPLLGKALDDSYNREAAKNIQAVEAEYGEIQRSVTLELKSLHRSFSLRRNSIVLRESLVQDAQQLYADAQERFNRGLITVNELALDEDRLYTVELALITEWLELHNQATQLCHGLGYRLRQCVNMNI